MKYRKKPVIIDAEQWTDHFSPRPPGSILNQVLTMAAIPGDHTVNPDALCDACGGTMLTHGWIITLEGPMRVCPGDQIIRGVRGEFYPCKPDIFLETYERVYEESAPPPSMPPPNPLPMPINKKHHHHLLVHVADPNNVIMAVLVDDQFYSNDDGTHLPLTRWKYVRALGALSNPDERQSAEQIARGLGLDPAAE